jgi:hypothetical protein
MSVFPRGHFAPTGLGAFDVDFRCSSAERSGHRWWPLRDSGIAKRRRGAAIQGCAAWFSVRIPQQLPVILPKQASILSSTESGG